MKPFRFGADSGKNASELQRFMDAARPWKPAGYNEEMQLRLEYYLDQQARDIAEQLKSRFPGTHLEMVPHFVPLTRNIVDQLAKTFIDSTKLDLIENGEPLPADNEISKWWDELKEMSGLRFRLAQGDRFAELLKIVFLKVVRDPKKKCLHIQLFFPHLVNIVPDPGAPTDLDRAYGILLEVGSEAGPYASATEEKRYEFWCGRQDSAQHLVLKGTGEAEKIEGNEENVNPFSGKDGDPLVPIVALMPLPEELGLFTLAGQGLHLTNRAINVTKTDLHHISEAQGYGQMVITKGVGSRDLPAKIERGPNRAMVLPEGVTADMLNGNPILAEMQEIIEKDIKLEAVLSGVPSGSVSLDGRAVASGVALQIERQPLTELRKDRIESYKSAMRRLWEVIRTVANTYADDDGRPEIADTVDMRWKPGDMEPPTDSAERLEQALTMLANNLTTRAKILAQMHGLSEDEAKKLLDDMKGENEKLGAGEQAQQAGGDLGTFRRAVAERRALKTPGEQMAEKEEPAPEA